MILIQLKEQLKSLTDLLSILNSSQYNNYNTYLGNASIGGHTRHIIELLQCVTNGYNNSIVDYNNRERNLQIETDKAFAEQLIDQLIASIDLEDKPMQLLIDSPEMDNAKFVSTTYNREIVYNTEHTIHHLALIKVALREMQLDIVSNDFGMAYSTIQYRATTDVNNNN